MVYGRDEYTTSSFAGNWPFECFNSVSLIPTWAELEVICAALAWEPREVSRHLWVTLSFITCTYCICGISFGNV